MAVSPTDVSASLKAVCPRKDLFEAVQTVGHAVSGRSALPILSHILIREEDSGLRLIATDLELGISCRIPATVLSPGGLTAPSRPLSEVLANLPDKSDVALSADKSYTVRVHCEKSDYKILGLASEEYPHLPEVKQEVFFRIPQAKLREMIRQTRFAVGTDETRPILTGILMAFDGSALKMVATDTHRLAVKEATVSEGSGAQNAIVPARAMNELSRLLTGEEGDVEVRLSTNQALFLLPGENQVQLSTRLIEGQFPNFQRVIPAEYHKLLTVATAPLKSAVKRASIVARENSQRVIFRTEEGKLALTAESQIVGNAYEELDAEREGDDVEIAFNAKYLLEALDVIEEERLHLELSEPLRPGVLRPVPAPAAEGQPPAKPDYLCVLMPMQIY